MTQMTAQVFFVVRRREGRAGWCRWRAAPAASRRAAKAGGPGRVVARVVTADGAVEERDRRRSA